MRSIELPLPDPAALAVSRRLARLAGRRILESGGWIGFDAWMAAALYEPGLGYYAGGARKFGAGGDFVTAPELDPLFGACLAAQCAEWFADAPARIHEFGAGSGALAADLLLELEALGTPAEEYLIVEVSGALRERQRETIAARAPGHLHRVRWLDAWPQRMSGVVLGNELLDAMPARAFRLRGGEVFERGVAVGEEWRDAVGAGSASAVSPGAGAAGGCAGPGAAGRGPRVAPDAPDAPDPDGSADDEPVPAFHWSERPADPAFAATVRELLAGPIAAAGGDWPGDDWPDDYCGEVGEQAAAWVREAGRRLERGAILLVDYGFPRHEFHHPQRGLGTLMCHYRHHAHGDPFLLPGLQDITVHVDFTSVADAAGAAGLDLLGYTSQARLLLNLGVLERLAAGGVGDDLGYRRRAQAVQTLVSEAEMGELFKAIAFGRGVAADPLGFRRGDRSGALAGGRGGALRAEAAC